MLDRCYVFPVSICFIYTSQMPKRQTYSLVFLNESWFYPILFEYTSNDTLFHLIGLFQFNLGYNHQFLEFARNELTKKRLATFLRFDPRYYKFGIDTLRFATNTIGIIENCFVDSALKHPNKNIARRNFFSLLGFNLSHTHPTRL